LKNLCRKHFNEHRDKLSKDLLNVFDHHDTFLQELQIKIDRASKPSDNDNARVLLNKIDNWEKEAIERVSQAANEVRVNVERLFSRKVEYNQLKQKIDQTTNELKEQQESESFLETDIDRWLKQLEQLIIDLNRPSTAETNPPILQIQNVDWNAIIKVTSPSTQYEKSVHVPQNHQKRGMLCSISIKHSRTSKTNVVLKETPTIR
jgi:preprotein translocase subunit SecD